MFSALVLAAALGSGAPLLPPAPRARIVTIEAFDFAFRAPASVPEGLVTIRLVNRGTQLHHVQLNRLAPGVTLGEMVKRWKPGVSNDAILIGQGGPTAATAGQTIEGQVRLVPGRYAIICWVPAPDGVLHMHKGMMGTIEVTAAAGERAAAEPRADATIELMDYGYVVPALKPGRQTIAVVNRGPQSHEVLMVRLADGRTPKDAAEWAHRGQTGERPGEMIGGVAALAAGGKAWFTADLKPGRYALLCFVPDQRDGVGRAHAEYGMLREMVVR